MSIRVYIDGQVCGPEQAVVPVLDRGFLFGDSVYETVALLGGRGLPYQRGSWDLAGHHCGLGSHRQWPARPAHAAAAGSLSTPGE